MQFKSRNWSVLGYISWSWSGPMLCGPSFISGQAQSSKTLRSWYNHHGKQKMKKKNTKSMRLCEKLFLCIILQCQTEVGPPCSPTKVPGVMRGLCSVCDTSPCCNSLMDSDGIVASIDCAQASGRSLWGDSSAAELLTSEIAICGFLRQA